MSAWLRRRRAEQFLQREYVLQRDNVLRAVRGKLAREGIHLDDADLDAFYNQAWHGVYGQILEGVQVENPPGLLVRVTYCRAIDEYRKLHVARRADEVEVAEHGLDPDTAQHLDDEAKLRQFTEGLRDRLSRRECEAATLCYLLGLSRPEAAERLGVEPKRMEKIMDAVSKKVGEFVRDIEAGAWCERRGSLMRAYALGVLDPEGERHRLAREHLGACSGCRAYVRSLRGLGAALPPVGLPLGGGGLLEPVLRLLDGVRDLLGAKLAIPATAKLATAAVVVTTGAGGVVAARPTPPAQAPASAPRAVATPAAPVLRARPGAVAPAARPRRARPSSKRIRPRPRPVAKRASRRAPNPVATPAPTPAPTAVAAPPSQPVATAVAPPAPRPAPTAAPPVATPAPDPAEFSFESAQGG